jgi:proteasome component ECM29
MCEQSQNIKKKHVNQTKPHSLTLKTLLYYTDETARQACGLTLQSMCHQSQDIMKRHATQAMPLAFFAMHEKKEANNEVKGDNLSLWEDIWLEITPGKY